MGTPPRAIPVIMYHGVGNDYPGWEWNHLVIPVEVFDGQMRILKERGWTTISLEQLHAHMATGASVPERSIVLTFDDGYRDNYVHAFPILKKYGHRAAIWMSTDFVDPRVDCPPTLDDVWAKRVGMDELDARGYLSWAEMRRMVESGLVEIQSHAKTHTWYFSGPEIVDFHRPDGIDGYAAPMWLAWNAFPAEKYKSMHERMGKRLPYGEPIYRHGKSFAVRRYFEDQGLTGRLVAFVAENGGAEFFSRPGWRERLEAVARDYGGSRDPGAFPLLARRRHGRRRSRDGRGGGIPRDDFPLRRPGKEECLRGEPPGDQQGRERLPVDVARRVHQAYEPRIFHRSVRHVRGKTIFDLEIPRL
jgi:hypothetical protein